MSLVLDIRGTRCCRVLQGESRGKPPETNEQPATLISSYEFSVREATPTFTFTTLLTTNNTLAVLFVVVFQNCYSKGS